MTKVGGILKRMARFRDMRKFVRFVKDEHLENLDNKEVKERAKYEPEHEWPISDEIQQRYAKNENKTDREVADILDDCIGFRYLRFSKLKPQNKDYCLILTMRGRHLLLKLGLIREFARDNQDWLSASIAFIVGVMVASTPFVIFLLSRPAHTP